MRILSTIILSILVTLYSYAQRSVPIDSTEKTRYEKWIADIAYVENEFLPAAKTYTDESRDSCSVILAKLKNQIDALSDFQIRLELARCVVLADNAHTTLPLPRTDKIPLRLYRFSDGIYVVRTDSLASPHLGAKVLDINGIDVSQVERQLFPYLSGITRWKRFKTLDLITSPKTLYEAGIVTTEDALTFTLLKSQDTTHVSFKAQEVENDRAWFESWANLYPIPREGINQKFLLSHVERLPLYLQRTEEGVFYVFDEQEKIAYFHINSFWDQCSDFKERIALFTEALKSKRDYDVVVDLRFYTGGNYALAVKLATDPPKIINEDKKIYLITSDKTYSAGIVTAARVKHYAKDKIVLVGEGVGDRLKFWAESERFTLPHSGIRIYNSKKEHDWQDNKKSIFKTHILNYFFGVGVKDLKVDQEIKLSFQDYMDNRDPILAWITSQ
ncbi:MAG: hypothetical protein AAFW00_21505 [Bacteroidota bacterium]